MRPALAALLLLCCLLGVILIFWNQEYRYSLPTPVPADYKPVSVGEKIQLPAAITSSHKKYFLHFYNPECPCSRFNARHIRELIRHYGEGVQLCIVVPDAPSLKKARAEFGNNLLYYADENKKLAKTCGVYSTPQAVLIDHDNRLYYRGNYNKARYCTSKATNYAELALIALLNNQPPPLFDLAATTAYGCSFVEQNNPFTELNFFR